MKQIIIPLVLSIFLFFAISNLAEARQGCCSHHGGVCGCRCCDGTSLSATCAPYYPECNNPVVRTTTTTPTKPIKSDSVENITKNIKTSETTDAVVTKDSNIAGWVILIIVMMGLAYSLGKIRNKK